LSALSKKPADHRHRDVERESPTGLAIKDMAMSEPDTAALFCEDQQLSHFESQIVINACNWRSGNHGDGSVTALREIVRYAEMLINIAMEDKQ